MTPQPMPQVRVATPRDASAIAAIYNHYILQTTVTFEEVPVPDEEMRNRMIRIMEGFPWLVAEDETGLLGYAYAGPWNTRCAYRLSAESTIYLDSGATGRGLGKRLYRQLFDELPRLGFHTVIGGIALPNTSSVALHESLGFQKVAHFREVGRKFDRWIDVGYWQKFL